MTDHSLVPPVLRLADLSQEWRRRAEGLRPFAEPAARAFDVAAEELSAALAREYDEPVTVTEAGRLSGYSGEHLARLVREGRIPNAGRLHAPRIRRGDVPRRAAVARQPASGYDPAADARELLSARREGT